MHIVTKNDLLKNMSSLLTYADRDMKISMKEIDLFSKGKQKLYMSTAKYSGFNAVVEATKIIINDFYTNQLDTGNSLSVLIHYTVNPEMPMDKIIEGMRIIRDEISVDANIYMG